MFPFYGRKKGIVDYYPEPKYRKIIEPFAGSASYSLKYWYHDITLYEIDPVIYNIWVYLIHKASSKRILELPLDYSKTNQILKEEKDLIGFFIRSCSSRPNKNPSKHPNFNLWTSENRAILAENVEKVKHWRIYNKECNSNFIATWFIDPPYQHGGSYYKYSNVDYKKLAEWCLSRKGQLIVCENDKADWLPFVFLKKAYQRGHKNNEVIYLI